MELRDEDVGLHHGRGVQKAVDSVNKVLGPAVVRAGPDPAAQTEVDQLLLATDGTENKKRLGANAILGVSMAVCKAGAAHKGVPLYRHIADLAEVKVNHVR